jgi:hypothetical protein
MLHAEFVSGKLDVPNQAFWVRSQFGLEEQCFLSSKSDRFVRYSRSEEENAEEAQEVQARRQQTTAVAAVMTLQTLFGNKPPAIPKHRG